MRKLIVFLSFVLCPLSLILAQQEAGDVRRGNRQYRKQNYSEAEVNYRRGLDKNKNGYTFALSKVDALSWGIGSKSSYDRAVAELIEKGYLVRIKGNHYNFFERPKEEQLVITVNKDGFTF